MGWDRGRTTLHYYNWHCEHMGESSLFETWGIERVSLAGQGGELAVEDHFGGLSFYRLLTGENTTPKLTRIRSYVQPGNPQDLLTLRQASPFWVRLAPDGGVTVGNLWQTDPVTTLKIQEVKEASALHLCDSPFPFLVVIKPREISSYTLTGHRLDVHPLSGVHRGVELFQSARNNHRCAVLLSNQTNIQVLSLPFFKTKKSVTSKVGQVFAIKVGDDQTMAVVGKKGVQLEQL